MHQQLIRYLFKGKLPDSVTQEQINSYRHQAQHTAADNWDPPYSYPKVKIGSNRSDYYERSSCITDGDVCLESVLLKRPDSVVSRNTPDEIYQHFAPIGARFEGRFRVWDKYALFLAKKAGIKPSQPKYFKEPLRAFYNTLRGNRIVTDENGNSVKDTRTGWLKLASYPPSDHPQWEVSWNGYRRNWETENPRLAYIGNPQPPVPCGYVNRVKIIYSHRYKRYLFRGYSEAKTELPKTDQMRKQRLPENELRQLFDPEYLPEGYKHCFLHHLQKSAQIQYAKKWQIWHILGYIGTAGFHEHEFEVFRQVKRRRCEDIESLFWEAIWLDRGAHNQSLSFVAGAFLRDKLEAKGKYGATEPGRVVRFNPAVDIERLRRAWKKERAIERPDEPTSVEIVFKNAAEGARWGKSLESRYSGNISKLFLPKKSRRSENSHKL